LAESQDLIKNLDEKKDKQIKAEIEGLIQQLRKAQDKPKE